MSDVVGSIPVIGPLLETLGTLLEMLPILKDKFLKFKNNEINKEVKQLIINGDINAPVYVTTGEWGYILWAF